MADYRTLEDMAFKAEEELGREQLFFPDVFDYRRRSSEFDVVRTLKPVAELFGYESVKDFAEENVDPNSPLGIVLKLEKVAFSPYSSFSEMFPDEVRRFNRELSASYVQGRNSKKV